MGISTATFLKDNARWLGAGAVLTFLSSFGQTFFISLFAGEIREAYGLTDGGWGNIYAAGTLASAIVMVWAGSLTDRFRTRQIGIAILVGLALACVMMAVNPYVSLLVVAVFLLRFFGQGMASHAAVVAMSRWFDATRGRALAVCTLGFTFAEAVFPILFVALLAFVDWRLLWIVAALVSLAGIPLLVRLLKTERHPKQASQDMSAAGMGGRHWSRRDMLTHPLFWLMVPAILGPSAFNTAFFFHQVHYAELTGWTHLALVALFPVYTVFAVFWMLASGRALDAFGTARLLPIYQLPMLVAFLLFSLGGGAVSLVFGLFCLAITSGANSTLPNAFWAEFYGTEHLGAIKATAAAVMVLGSAIGPLITGQLIDAGVALTAQYVFVALFFLATSAALFVGMRVYRNDVARYRDLRK